LATLGLAVAVYLAWPGRPTFAPQENGGAPEITPVTSDPGLSINPSISADGKFVAYSSDRSGDGNLDIWVKQIGGGDPIRLTRDPADDVEPNISPDGTHVVFRSERDGGGVYIVPTTGGEERRIADGGRRPQYSPDGSKVLYWTGPSQPFPLQDGVGKIFVLDLVRSTTHQIRPEFTAAADPIWSPDGKKILFAGAKESAIKDQGWWTAPLDGGPAVHYSGMGPNDWYIPFAWQGDWIYFEWLGHALQTVGRLAVEPLSGRPYGKPQRISASTTDAYSPSVSKTGTLVFSSLDAAYNLYALLLDPNTAGSKGRLTRLSKDPGLNIVRSLSPDGSRLVFTSARLSKPPQVWVRDLANGLERAVTDGNLGKSVALISPDGQSIAWQSEVIGKPGILLTPFAGGPARLLYTEWGSPKAWSVDGKFILCDQASGHTSIGLIDATGKITPYLAASNADVHASSVSNDGKWLAFSVVRSAVESTVYAAPFAPDRSPPPSEWVKIIDSPEVHRNPHWSPDGSLLYFTSNRDGYNCIWALRVNGGTKRPKGQLFAVRHFHQPGQRLIAPSSHALHIPVARDRIALTLKEDSGGIWMAKMETGR
jgi:Tol biopolymer transport system component